MPNPPQPSFLPSSPSNLEPDPNPNANAKPDLNPNQDQEDPQILSSDQEQEDPEPEMSGEPPSPARGNPVISSTLRRGKRKKTYYQSQVALAKKLNTLSQNLNLIPFNPAKVLNFTRFEAYLKRLDLWEFCHIEFDASLRVDLIAQLLASYNAKGRGSYVNEYKINVSRAAVGKALRLPGKKGGDFEEYPDEFVLFLGEFVSSWMLLHGDEVWATPNEVVNWLGLIREKQLEKVDWAGLVWFMVEKEVSQGSGLRNCYYASHLQRLIKEQRAHLFEEKCDDDEMVGGDDGGEVKMVDGGILEEGRDGGSAVVEGFGPVEGDDGEGDKVDSKVDVDGEHEGGSVGEGVDKIESVESGKCVDNDEFVDVNVKTGDSTGDRFENAGDCVAERAEDAGECVENSGERAGNAGEGIENAGDCGESAENADKRTECADVHSGNGDEHNENVDEHTDKGDEHAEKVDDHTEKVDAHNENDDKLTEKVDEHNENDDKHTEKVNEHNENDNKHTQNVDEHNENDDDHVKYSGEQVENDENAREMSMDIDMMDLGYGKGDGQGQWLLNSKNDGGRFCLQRCTTDSMKASFEDRRQDEAEDDEDDNDDGDDNEEDEHVEGFKIIQKGPLEGMTSSNLVHNFETVQLQFAPQELGQSSRVENNVIMGDPSMFNHFGKRLIGLDHDISHHGLNDNHKKPRFDSSVVQKAADFNTCMEQMQFWFEKAKMSLEATRDEMCQNTSMNEQILAHQIAEKDNEILELKFKLDELHRRKQTDIHRRDRELYLMNSVIEGYKRALKQTQKLFTEFRKRHGITDEPIYKDAGKGGVVKSVMELEKERIKQEEEKKMMCQTIEATYNLHLDNYMLQWEELDNKVLSLESKLNDASKELESLKNHLVKRKSLCVN